MLSNRNTCKIQKEINYAISVHSFRGLTRFKKQIRRVVLVHSKSDVSKNNMLYCSLLPLNITFI